MTNESTTPCIPCCNPDPTPSQPKTVAYNGVGFLQAANGVNSSKRLCGVILLGIGIIMGISLFVIGLDSPKEVFRASYDVMQSFLITGTSLLGLGLVENLNKIFERSKRSA